jgi:branched-chain amino acid aminotransferase
MARAARGGTGDVKAGANYAGTLRSIDRAKKQGCAQVLYLDSLNRGLIEEMGGMNIFFLINDQLVTPALKDTILPGITRATVIALAADLGIPLVERQITIQEIEDACRANTLKEAFACGTAATVVGIHSFLFENGSRLTIPGAMPGLVTEQLLTTIQGIQYGSISDPHHWIRVVTESERMIGKANGIS